MVLSSVSSDAFMQYINTRQWVERSLQFSHEGCLENDEKTWSEKYYLFLEEISTVFKVVCTREEITRALFLIPVPYRDAIINSLSVIIAQDAFYVIDFFRQRYDVNLLLPRTNDVNALLSYYKPFTRFTPRKVVDFLLTNTDINYVDIFHLGIRSSNYLLLKRVIYRINDITKSVFYKEQVKVDFRFNEEADVEDSCLINFFDYFIDNFRQYIEPEYASWDNIVKSIIDSRNEELLLHVLSREDCVLSFDVFSFCVETSIVTAWNVGKILELRNITLNKHLIDLLFEKDDQYRFESYCAIGDKNRRIIEEIGGKKYMNLFPEVLLNEVIFNCVHMSMLGMKGIVSVKKMMLHSVAVTKALDNKEPLPDVFYTGTIDPQKKYNEYFVVEEFVDQPNDWFVKTLYSLFHDPRSPYHNSYVVRKRLELCNLNTSDINYLEQWMSSTSPAKNEKMTSLEQSFASVSLNKKRPTNDRNLGWVPPPPKEKKRDSHITSSSSMSDYGTTRGPSKSNKNKKKGR